MKEMNSGRWIEINENRIKNLNSFLASGRAILWSMLDLEAHARLMEVAVKELGLRQRIDHALRYETGSKLIGLRYDAARTMVEGIEPGLYQSGIWVLRIEGQPTEVCNADHPKVWPVICNENAVITQVFPRGVVAGYDPETGSYK